MIKTLLSLDENLSSSIALRYACQQADTVSMQLQAIHVEEPDSKRHSAGSGWIRRTWEKGLMEAGADEVSRLIKTENVNCSFIGPPKVFVGDKHSEVLEELTLGSYDLFMEGDLNTSNVTDFNSLLSSKLYRKSPCPVLIVKNLVMSKRAALVCGSDVDHEKLLNSFLKIFRKSGHEIDLLYYRFLESDTIEFLEKQEAGSALTDMEKELKAAGLTPERSAVVCGSPEKVGDYLRSYSLVASTFPTRKGHRQELLAHIPAPVFLCR